MRAMIFYSMTDAEIADPKLTDRGLADVKSKGFDSIYLEYRRTAAPFDSARHVKALGAITAKARKLGLEVIIDTHPRAMQHRMLAEDPEALADAVKPVVVEVDRGGFCLETPGEILHRRIERAWLIEEDRPGLLKTARDVTTKLVPGEAVAEGGGCAMTQVRTQLTVRQQFAVKGVKTGKLFLVVRYLFGSSGIDLGHPAVRKQCKAIHELLENVPCEGYAWDEPGYGFAFYPDEGRTVSDRLLARYKKRFGHRLEDRYLDLWFDRPKSDSATVRLNYARLLEEDLFGLERWYKRSVVKCKDGTPTIGIHRTMHEETSDDLLFGSADYFLHNSATSDGFTDSIFHREDSMVTMLQLARSLAVTSEGGRAFNNSWGFHPTDDQLDYYLGLMAAMNVRWIGHLYHGSTMFGPGYPDHPTWKTMRSRIDRLTRAVGLLEGAVPEADTAVLYNPRALCQYAGNYMHAHRSGLLMLGKELTLAGTQFQFVSAELLDKAKVSDDGVKTAAGRFKRLVVPWPDRLPARCWETIETMAGHGLEVVFYGPPPGLDAEGNRADRRFATLCGIEPVDPFDWTGHGDDVSMRLGSMTCRCNPEHREVKFYNAPKRTYPDRWRRYALRPKRHTEAAGKIGKDVAVVRSGSVVYVAAEAPLFEDITARVAAGVPAVTAPRGVLSFAWTRGKEKLVSLLGHWNQPFEGEIDWDGRQVAIDKPTDFVVLRCSATGHLTVERFDVLPHRG